MSRNLFHRIITSIILIIILLLVIFSNYTVLVSSLSVICVIICYEASNIISKILMKDKNNGNQKLNTKFLLFNIITFFYIFFIFFQFSYQIYKTEGSIFLLFIIFVCFFTDIGGYFVGKIVGGKKLTNISPNKTISGTIGSFIFCILPLLIFKELNYLNFEYSSNSIIFVILISFVSQMGDLFISHLKRRAKIKDTGSILPGHGGILDRLDGIIFALPFSYFLLKII